LVTLLGDHGHRVLEAADSEQALAIVRAEKPDLVLADILIGNMDGLSAGPVSARGSGLGRPRLIFLTPPTWKPKRAPWRALAEYRSSSSSPPGPKRSSRASMRHFPGRHRRRESRPSSRPLPRHILRSMAGKLYQRVAELEQVNAQLDQRAAERTSSSKLRGPAWSKR